MGHRLDPGLEPYSFGSFTPGKEAHYYLPRCARVLDGTFLIINLSGFKAPQESQLLHPRSFEKAAQQNATTTGFRKSSSPGLRLKAPSPT